jgi:hypothetical protein
MSRISRRRALELIGAAPAAAALVWTPAEAQQAHEHAAAALSQASATGASYKPRFFTAHEYATVLVLVDLIIPRDERSGSATEAGVPEFMDFIMLDQPPRQVAMRGGLALLDRLSVARAGVPFVRAAAADRSALLDDIAFTTRAAAEPRLAQAIAFFSSFRDLTASGFFTSKMGMADLQYRGNVFLEEWHGCSEEALRKVGVRS